MQPLHVFLTFMKRVCCLKNSNDHLTLRCPYCALMWGAFQFSLMFCRRCLLRDMVIYAFMFLWIFSGLWLLYFCINAVFKMYLLDLYSYRKYFIIISLKEKSHSAPSFDRAVRDLTCLSLFYLIQPERKFFVACVLTAGTAWS